MGAGVAKQAAELWPDLPWLLAERFEMRQRHAPGATRLLPFAGNHVHCFVLPPEVRKAMRCVYLFTFPTKELWRNPSHLTLITQSATELVAGVDLLGIETVILPRPGCGNGGLNWPVVKDCLQTCFDARFTVMSGENDG